MYKSIRVVFATPEGKSLFSIVEVKEKNIPHFLINRKGNITQYVSCLNRAWHAGKSRWRNRHECNDFSIGIELEGTDTTRFTEKQYFNLAKLTKVLKRKFAIREIVSHSEIALPIGRKSDPGDLFEWDKYKKLIE